MRDYGKVHTSFWSSDTIRALSDDGRMLALYLMTSPHTTLTGTFRLPDGYASEDLGWTPARVAKGFGELFANGFANRCETTKWVWIIKHLDWNPPENPNQRKAAAKMAGTIPSQCSWKLAFMRVSAEMLGLETPEISNGCETLSEPLRNQEQEQEQEQKKKNRSPDKPADVLDSVWSDFIAIRKVKRSPLTQTALAGIEREAKAAGMPLNEALQMACVRGWQSFKASWIDPKEQQTAKATARGSGWWMALGYGSEAMARADGKRPETGVAA